jgi:hypothetical protein
MTLLAEEIVEEWLNRQATSRYAESKWVFTKLTCSRLNGWRPERPSVATLKSKLPCGPVSYISRVPKKQQKAGRSAKSAKRSDEELILGVTEWVEIKFRCPDKKTLMAKLWNGDWSSELVVNVVKSENEVKLIADHGIKILRLNEIVSSLARHRFVIGSASGADIIDLIHMGSHAEVAS